MLKMAMEKWLEEYGLEASIEAADAGTAGGFGADIILGTEEFRGSLEGLPGHIVIVKNFVFEKEVEEKLKPIFAEYAKKAKKEVKK